MIHRCRSTKTARRAGHTHWTTRSSTTAWFHLAQPRATRECGKCRWWCGKIWMADVARWETPAPTQPMPMESTKWSSRTSSVITRRTERLSVFTTTQLGSLSPTIKRASSPSSTPLTPWMTSTLWPTGRRCNGSETPRPRQEWIRSSHSSAIIRWVLKLFNQFKSLTNSRLSIRIARNAATTQKSAISGTNLACDTCALASRAQKSTRGLESPASDHRESTTILKSWRALNHFGRVKKEITSRNFIYYFNSSLSYILHNNFFRSQWKLEFNINSSSLLPSFSPSRHLIRLTLSVHKWATRECFDFSTEWIYK